MKTKTYFLFPKMCINKVLIIFYLSIFNFFNFSYCQNNLLDVIDLDFTYHVIDKSGSKDVYIKWNEFDLNNIVYVNSSIINRPPNTSGLFLSNVSFPFSVRIVQNHIGNVVTDKEFSLVEKDISIVEVSNQMLEKLTIWEDSESDLFSFFDSEQSIPKEELFSFYQSFLSISPHLMDEILINSSVNSTSKFDFGDRYWAKGPRGGDTIAPVECNCKMIKTNSSAINVPNGNPSGSPSPQCNMAAPTWQNPEFIHQYSNIFWPTLLHFKWDAGMIGASKFGQMGLAVNGCKDTGIRRKTIGEAGLGASVILFRMMCYSPQTLTYNNKCQCEKQISIEYQYASHVKVSSASTGGVFCDRNSKIKVEDYAILTSNTGSGNASSVNSGIALVSSVCNRPADTSFISDIDNIFNTLKDVINNTTTASQIINGVGTIGQFFANQIANSGTCEAIDTAYTLLSGSSVFTFNSNQRQLRLTMLSRANFEGQAQGVASASAMLNSSFYLTAVLMTENPTRGCCQEKIGAYVLGTMMGVAINNGGSTNNMSSGQLADLGTLQTYVGSFIGSFSPWGGQFEGSGCCDDVLIDCYSKCAHLVEGECKTFGDGIYGFSSESRLKSKGAYWVKVNPVPALVGQTLMINISERPEKLELINVSGNILKIFIKPENNLTLPTSDLSAGVYFIRTSFKSNIKVNKIIVN